MLKLKPMNYYGIGSTPVITVSTHNGCKIVLKLERENFLGSIKARTGYFLLKGLSSEDQSKTIIESTSGNLGFALGVLCRETDLDFLCLIDETIAAGKLKRLESEHIHYRLVKQEKGCDLRTSRIRLAERMTREGAFCWVNQYDNVNAVLAHEQTTAPELFAQMDGIIDFCVCPMGSCGTICGLSRYLKSVLPDVKICGAEPLGSTIFGTHDAAYINAGAGLKGKPGNLLNNPDAVDMSFTVSDKDSILAAQTLRKKYGLYVGITSGMAYSAALHIAELNPGASIAVIAPDGGEAYAQYL